MITYDPSKLLKKIAPATKIKKLLKDNISLKRTALSFVDDIDFIKKSEVLETALGVISNYRDRIAEDPSIKAEILKDPAQLIQRVQDSVVFQVSEGIKENYDGEFYIWLPSDAETPDPEHQLNYGKKFQIGDGEQPGERYGCLCGMQILVDASSLAL